MSDVFDKAKRSAVMARIRGSGNTATELRMISIFRAYRITGWRRNAPLSGKPDFTFRRERVVIFVDGCFWHGCPKPKHSPLPKTRADWWAEKLSRNKKRDSEVNRALSNAGWTVIRIWECELAKKNWDKIAKQILTTLGTAGESSHTYDRSKT